jgi:hypothetical protein
MTRRQVQQLVLTIQQSNDVKPLRVAASMLDGRMVCEWEAESKDQIEAYWKLQNIHYDVLIRVEYEWPEPPAPPG